jgi:hypothetical protein
MRHHRFDVLPVESSDGSVRAYFRATRWGDYSSIIYSKITHHDVLPLHTHIRDVLRGFALEDRSFYFLTNEDRMAGLISFVNFNCRQVKTYLFSLISEFELRLGQFLLANVSEEGMIDAVSKGNHRERSAVLDRFEKDKALGVDVKLVEYLYLSQLFEILVANRLYNIFESESGADLNCRFAPIKKLRNQVAHPTKSLITEPDSCRKLWVTIDAIEEALFKLRQMP